ncbi:transcriptional regulator, HTH_XRE family [Psychroflexus torquis ATCC 700755]|uniref:Transcriptional regulator, HTH_XRE family n=1 Tax=Psychroflexus torquis (strain ATCC 700755 / CIP 106069 / ACAM 623) TaxID=313595 RepID=K4IY54_PSYTT|nr:helix-turn-helix transcriptional regulator [Psychroflexus torquis]AFU70415.1 transcriptional regulator, HTH_XRE family [Psychroflexus torquis ATCC 700755]
MVNSLDFTKRLKEIFEYYDLSASSFADRIDVGRASISHIISGRNKPSLDFVMKVVSNFKEVELYWLLNGKGYFPSSKDNRNVINAKEEFVDDIKPEEPKTIEPLLNDNSNQVSHPKKEIQKVIICYTDGSFESFQN